MEALDPAEVQVQADPVAHQQLVAQPVAASVYTVKELVVQPAQFNHQYNCKVVLQVLVVVTDQEPHMMVRLVEVVMVAVAVAVPNLLPLQISTVARHTVLKVLFALCGQVPDELIQALM